MKIQIVQSELEESIRTYVRSMISVQPGMRIDIELRATRGEDGFIANIDILPDDAANAPAVASMTVAAQPTRTAAPAAVAATQASQIVEEAVIVDDPPFEDSKPVTNLFANSAPAGRDTGDEDPDAPEGEAPLKPSIFSGLRRPVNSAAEPALADA